LYQISVKTFFLVFNYAINLLFNSRLIKPDGERKSSKRQVSNEDTKLSTDVENNFDAIQMARWALEEPNIEMEGTFIGM
jgi:hypothetical protein